MKKTTLLVTTAFLTLSSTAVAQEEKLIIPDGTFLFEKRDGEELFLDVYNPAEGSETTLEGKPKPTIMFMFGG